MIRIHTVFPVDALDVVVTMATHLYCVRVHVCMYLLRSAAARKEVAVIVPVEGDVEDIGVTVEGLLGAVAMVNVLQQQVTVASESQWNIMMNTLVPVNISPRLVLLACVKAWSK